MVDRSEIIAASLESTGGAVPPPGAPREFTQPLSDQAVADQLARASANERELKPLVFEQRPLVSQPVVSAVEALSSQRRIRQVRRTAPDTAPAGSAVVLTDADEIAPPPSAAQPVPTGFTDLDPPLLHQRAASNTDSPSRGIPKATTDPGKQVTGGFGDAGQAQYYPLDGLELKELVRSLLDKLNARIEDDLRFSLAICYPRVSVRLELIVDGYPVDAGFQIPTVLPPYEKTPIEVARDHGNDIVFVVREQHVEMSAEGESVTPPNLLRQELGLRVPRKQALDTPMGRQMVDVLT